MRVYLNVVDSSQESSRRAHTFCRTHMEGEVDVGHMGAGGFGAATMSVEWFGADGDGDTGSVRQRL